LLEVVRQRQLQRTKKKENERNTNEAERNEERNTNEAEVTAPNVTVRRKTSRLKLPPQGEKNDRSITVNHSSSDPEGGSNEVATTAAAASTAANVITPRPGGDTKRPAVSFSTTATTPIRTVDEERTTNQTENDLCITGNNNNTSELSCSATAANTITPRAVGEVRFAESSESAAATPRAERLQDSTQRSRPRSDEGANSLAVATADTTLTNTAAAPAIITPTAASFSVGAVVTVQSRTWPGINKPGGVAKVTASEAVTFTMSDTSWGVRKNASKPFSSPPKRRRFGARPRPFPLTC
jgi:hypothetical protein